VLRSTSVPRMPAPVSPLTVATPANPMPTTTTLGAPVADARRVTPRNLAISPLILAALPPPARPRPGRGRRLSSVVVPVLLFLEQQGAQHHTANGMYSNNGAGHVTVSYSR